MIHLKPASSSQYKFGKEILIVIHWHSRKLVRSHDNMDESHVTHMESRVGYKR